MRQDPDVIMEPLTDRPSTPQPEMTAIRLRELQHYMLLDRIRSLLTAMLFLKLFVGLSLGRMINTIFDQADWSLDNPGEALKIAWLGAVWLGSLSVTLLISLALWKIRKSLAD